MSQSENNISLTGNAGQHAASSDARAKKCRRKSFYSLRAGGYSQRAPFPLCQFLPWWKWQSSLTESGGWCSLHGMLVVHGEPEQFKPVKCKSWYWNDWKLLSGGYCLHCAACMLRSLASRICSSSKMDLRSRVGTHLSHTVTHKKMSQKDQLMWSLDRVS